MSVKVRQGLVGIQLELTLTQIRTAGVWLDALQMFPFNTIYSSPIINRDLCVPGLWQSWLDLEGEQIRIETLLYFSFLYL